jgi:hypothetical protein
MQLNRWRRRWVGWHGRGATNAGAGTGIGSVTITYTALPTSKEQCKEDGWKNFGTTFKNQGQCVSFVEAEKHAS